MATQDRPLGERQGPASSTPEVSTTKPTATGAVSVAEAPPAHRPAGANGQSVGTFDALRYRNYRFAWVGDLFNSAAMWIQQTTMGWVVYDITGSGSILGLMNGIRAIPTLFLTPFAGASIDHFNRQKIIAVSQLAQFAATFVLAIVVALGMVEVWHLMLFTVLIASTQVFNQPARQTLVFDLVPRHVIANAIALSQMAFSVARSVGPAIGGGLIVLLGAATNFFLQAFAYLGVMTAILLIKVQPREQPASHEKKGMFTDIVDGYKFALHDPQIRLLMVMTSTYPLFIIPLHNVLLPIFAKHVLDSGAGGFGVLLASVGVGGLVGGVVTASLNNVDRRGMLQIWSVFLCAVPLVVFSIVAELTGELWIAVWFLLLSGVGGSVFHSTNQTIVQLLAPEHMRGRLTSILQISFLFASLSALAAGAAADIFGAVAVGIALGTTSCLVGLGVLIFSPRMRELRLSNLDKLHSGGRHEP